MKDIETLAKERNVEYRNLGNGHIQLTGVVLVNYYPSSRKRSAYISGSSHGIPHCSIEKAVELAANPDGALRHVGIGGYIRRRHRATAQRARRRLYRKHKHCHWCRTPLSFWQATINHIIPLSKGGLDQDNNRVIACEPCNHDRENDMPNRQYNHIERKGIEP